MRFNYSLFVLFLVLISPLSYAESRDWLLYSWTALMQTSSQQITSVTEKQCKAIIEVLNIERPPTAMQAMCIGPNGESFVTNARDKPQIIR